MFEINKKSFGEFISMLRKEKSMTQKELASRLLVSDKAVSKWETGIIMPDTSIMLELCDILCISANELLSGEKLTWCKKVIKK